MVKAKRSGWPPRRDGALPRAGAVRDGTDCDPSDGAAKKESFAARTAVGRWGEPAELAPTALLLASPAGSYITGAVIVVDGGVTARMW